MFRIKPTVSQLNKYYSQTENLKTLPKEWVNFARLTTIRSGGEMVLFNPYLYQVIISDLMDRYNNIVCVKSRQLGLTQIAVSKFLHRAALNPAYSAIAFLRNSNDASAVSRRTKQLLSGLSDYVVPDSDNVGYLKLKGLGEIYFKNSSREGSRSYDSVIDFLFDEAAFSENIDQIYAASSPSSAMSGDKITKLIVSTPSAKSGWYWNKLNENNNGLDIEEICNRVASGDLYNEIPGLYWFEDTQGTLKLIVHWSVHPVYQQIENYLDYRLKQDGTDTETVLREYDLKFVDSAVSVFSIELIRENTTGIYESDRDDKCDYYCGLDTSTMGSDYTVFSVLKHHLKADTYSLVHLYRKRQETSASHIYQISKLIELYKPKCVGIETTGGVGNIYLEELSKINYGKEFENIKTTRDTKTTMVGALILSLEKKKFSYPENSVLVEEMLSYRRIGAKFEAASGKHDDTIMSVSFALTVSPFLKKEKKLSFTSIPWSY
jgi:hypothetical protein